MVLLALPPADHLLIERDRGQIRAFSATPHDGQRRALTIAQQQQARWWELRAATTLAKHWRDEGKCLEAYSLLQPVYGWFVAGFDTTPLKDAKALLGELRDLSGTQTEARRE